MLKNIALVLVGIVTLSVAAAQAAPSQKARASEDKAAAASGKQPVDDEATRAKKAEAVKKVTRGKASF